MPDPDSPGGREFQADPRWRQHAQLIAVVLAVAVALAALAIFLATRLTDPAPPTPGPSASPSAPTAAPSTGTPATGIVYPAGSLPALLARAPDWLDDESQALPVQASYADIAGWLDAAGVDSATAGVADLQRATEPLGLPEVLASRGLSDQWRQVYGFDLRAIDQVLAVGQAPNLVLIMPGRYDAEALYATWVASGYQAVEVEGVTVWSLSPGERIDLTAPASRPALGLMNTVVLLDDGTLIATSRQSRMAATLRAVQGDVDSLLDHDGVREAAVTAANLRAPGVIIASGHLLQRPPGDGPLVGTAVPAGDALPEVDLVVLALLGTGPDSPLSMAMTMVYDEPPDDVETIPAVLERRVAADAGWSDRFRLERATVLGESGMVEVRIVPAAEGIGGLDQIDQRDLAPFSWLADD